jgi:hypothetical protein
MQEKTVVDTGSKAGSMTGKWERKLKKLPDTGSFSDRTAAEKYEQRDAWSRHLQPTTVYFSHIY